MLHKHIIFTSFSDYRFHLAKAKGSYIYDDQGKEYIDFTSGWNVTNLGWNHPEVIEAGITQLQENSFTPMWAMTPSQERYAHNLTQALGHKMEYIGRANGGVEAIEMAIKTARAYTGKKKIVSFYEQFHGSTINALSLSYRPEWMTKLTGPREDIIQVEYPNTYRTEKTATELLTDKEKELEKLFAQGDVAAVFTEAGIITGWGSVYCAPDGFLTMIRKLSKKYNVLLMLDEVGTGFGRTGTLWGMEREDISPDIITLAKAATNGSAPLSAMVTTKEIAEKTFTDTNLQSTFGWNPVACAIADKTLEIHLREKTWEMARAKGDFVRQYIHQKLAGTPHFGEVRGWGMENGIDLVIDTKTKQGHSELGKKVVSQAFAHGLHSVTDNSGVVHIMPPLTIEQATLEKGLEILTQTIIELS